MSISYNSNSDIVELNKSEIVITGISPNTGGTTNTATTIELDSGCSAITGCYDPGKIAITAGTGVGQERQIFEYNNRICYVNRDWKVIPDNTSEYSVKFWPGDSHYNEGYVRGSASSSITLNSLAPAANNQILGQCVHITAGTGQDQTRMIIAYNGTTKVATVDSAWIVTPAVGDIYALRPFPGFVHGLPTVNNSDDILIRDAVGNKGDFIEAPYSFGINSILAHLNTAYYHVHGESFVYPNHANAVLLTAGSGAWDLTGAIIEIIPAATLTTSEFDLHWMNISSISAVGEIQIDIYAGGVGAEVLIGATKATRSTSQTRNGPSRIQIPQIPSGTRVSARLSDSTAGALTCLVSVEGHFYA